MTICSSCARASSLFSSMARSSHAAACASSALASVSCAIWSSVTSCPVAKFFNFPVSSSYAMFKPSTVLFSCETTFCICRFLFSASSVLADTSFNRFTRFCPALALDSMAVALASKAEPLASTSSTSFSCAVARSSTSFFCSLNSSLLFVSHIMSLTRAAMTATIPATTATTGNAVRAAFAIHCAAVYSPICPVITPVMALFARMAACASFIVAV